jgi:hypothetical protein
MSTDAAFTPRDLTASEYVLALFEPTENVAVLVRNRSTRHTVQTIAKAEAVANPEFQRCPPISLPLAMTCMWE